MKILERVKISQKQPKIKSNKNGMKQNNHMKNRENYINKTE